MAQSAAPAGSATALNAEAKRISNEQADKSAEIARHALQHAHGWVPNPAVF